MPAEYVAVTKLLTATGGGTVDFTSPGFGTPAAAIVMYSGAADAENPSNNAVIGIGFWDGTNQRTQSIATRDNDGTGSKDVYRIQRDDYIAVIHDPASATTWKAGYQASPITDGVRLTLTVDNTTAECYCTVLLVKGVSAKVVTVSPNSTVDGTANSPSLGFAPTLVIGSTAGRSTNTAASGSSQTAGAQLSIGAASSDGTHRCVSWASDATTTSRVGGLQSETMLVREITGIVTAWGAEVTAWGGDGFTVTTRGSGTLGDTFFALALGGADLKALVGTVTTPTAAGSVDITTAGFDPKAVLVLGSGATASDTVSTDTNAGPIGMGVATRTHEAGYGAVDQDNASTSRSESRFSAEKTLNLVNSSGQVPYTFVQADTSFVPGKFSLNYTTVDAAAHLGWYLALGTPSAVSGQTLYVVAYDSGLGAPSAEQIAAGEDITGAQAAWDNGGVAWTGTGQETYATGLESSASLKAAATVYDPVTGTFSNVVVSDAFTILGGSEVVSTTSATEGGELAGTQLQTASIEAATSTGAGSAPVGVQNQSGSVGSTQSETSGTGLAGSQNQAAAFENTSAGVVGSSLAGTAVQTGSIENAASQVTGSQAGAYSEPAPAVQNASSSTSASVPAGTQVLDGAVENAESATEGSSVSPGTAFGTIEDSSSATQGTVAAGTQTQVAAIEAGSSLVQSSLPAGTQTVSAQIENTTTVVVGQAVFLGSETQGAVGSTTASSVASAPMGSQIQAGTVLGASVAVSVTTPGGTQLQLGIVITGVSLVLGSEPGEGESVGGPGTGVAQLPIYAQNRNLPIQAQNRVLPW